MEFVNIHKHDTRVFAGELAIVDLSGASHEEWSGCFSIGIHPMDADLSMVGDALDRIEANCLNERMLAIGECGLDKRSAFSLRNQMEVFRLQVELSEKYKKPLIIHCVKAFDELIALYKKVQPEQKWIIHSFRGNVFQMRQLQNMGLYFSFGPAFNEESVRQVSPAFMFAETDDSENVGIRDVYLQLAKAKGMQPEELCAIIKDNFRKIFKFEI